MSLPITGDSCVLYIAGESLETDSILVEGVRVSGWKLTREEVEVTTSGDDGWRRLLPRAGLRHLSIDVEGLYLGSEGELRLRQMAMDGLVLNCTMSLDHETSVGGPFMATELNIRSSVDDEVMFAVTLRSAGSVTIG